MMQPTKKGGLTITAPEGSICGLYPDGPATTHYFQVIKPENALPATEVSTGNGITTYYYENPEPGIYHCGTSMEGYTAICQLIRYTEEKAGMQVDMRLDKMAGTGFEITHALLGTEEMLQKRLLSKKDAWGEEYEKLFHTPVFRAGRPGRHQHTTQDELMDFIAKLDSPNVYVYSLGKSPKFGFDMPLVLFTRENVAGMTLEQAAQVVKNNGKPTVQYTAQCHSAEPASGEGAMAMMLQLCGEYGQKVLDKADVYIVPRINLDGAVDVIRTSPTTGEDMNRDYLFMHNQEVRMVTAAYNLFLPEACIDGHEKTSQALSTKQALCTDMELQVGAGSLNHPAAMTTLAMKMALQALDKGKDLGLRCHFYSKLASAAGGAAGSSYYGTRNSLSFLVETPGQAPAGTFLMERRVLAQYVLASTVIDYTAEHAEEIMDTVHSSREHMVKTGAVYDENDVIVLEHGKSQTGTWATPMLDVPSGEVVALNEIPYYEHTEALHTRPRATAYVIPKGLEKEAEIFRVAGNHALDYYELPAGSSVLLKQYGKNDDTIALSEEQAITFAQGAYVFPNTVPSTILGVIMEPDFGKSYADRKMNLLSMGLIAADENGMLPLYRYCHDLEDGKVKAE